MPGHGLGTVRYVGPHMNKTITAISELEAVEGNLVPTTARADSDRNYGRNEATIIAVEGKALEVLTAGIRKLSAPCLGLFGG